MEIRKTHVKNVQIDTSDITPPNFWLLLISLQFLAVRHPEKNLKMAALYKLVEQAKARRFLMCYHVCLCQCLDIT